VQTVGTDHVPAHVTAATATVYRVNPPRRRQWITAADNRVCWPATYGWRRRCHGSPTDHPPAQL